MSLRSGIVGLPNVGKSTIFNALTALDVPAENYPFCTVDSNIGVVQLPDVRLKELSNFFKPEKITPATVEFVDIAGLVKGASQGEGLGNRFLGQIRQVTAIIHVVRCFENNKITHVEGNINPIRDAELIETELLIKDIETINRKIEKAEKEAKGGGKQEKENLEILIRLNEHCNDGSKARNFHVNPEQERFLSQLHLLTQKPILYVANVDENEIMSNEKSPLTVELFKFAEKEQNIAIRLCGKLEQDLSILGPAEQAEFIKEYNLPGIGLNKLIKASYDLLELETFFTGGPNEVRAWTIKHGTLAPRAAGEIHTDFAKGFIKAEVYHYNDIIGFLSESALRDAGKIRLEGRNYIVKDGDIIYFKFNV